MNNRAAFIDFCQGLLNMDPIQRWTPQQARNHPFITGEKWTKPWQVGGAIMLPRNEALKRLFVANGEHATSANAGYITDERG